MIKNTKNLHKGDVIARETGYIMLASDYIVEQQSYKYVDLYVDENGDVQEVPSPILLVKAQDLSYGDIV